MFIFGADIDNTLVFWTIGIVFLLLLAVSIAFLVLYLKEAGKVQTVSNASTVTGQIPPQRYFKTQNLGASAAAIRDGSWNRVMIVGDHSCNYTDTYGNLNLQDVGIPAALGGALMNTQSSVMVQSIFGYDAALNDSRVTMSGSWDNAPASYLGIGGRYFCATSATSTLTFRASYTAPTSYYTFYALLSTGTFTINQAGNSTTLGVTAASLTPIPGTNLGTVRYLTDNQPNPRFVVTATGASASKPVQFFGLMLERGGQLINACVGGKNTSALFSTNTPTSLCGDGLTALKPDVIVFYAPISDISAPNAQPLSSSIAAVQTFLDICRGMSIPVLAVTPHWVASTTADVASQTAYANALKTLFASYGNVAVYDLQGDMVSLDVQKQLRLFNKTSNYVYLSNAGGVRAAQGIYNTFFQ